MKSLGNPIKRATRGGIKGGVAGGVAIAVSLRYGGAGGATASAEESALTPGVRARGAISSGSRGGNVALRKTVLITDKANKRFAGGGKTKAVYTGGGGGVS